MGPKKTSALVVVLVLGLCSARSLRRVRCAAADAAPDSEWACDEPDECCATFGPREIGAARHAACVPCSEFRPSFDGRSLKEPLCLTTEDLTTALGADPAHHFPSIRLYLKERTDLADIAIKVCRGDACNSPDPRLQPRPDRTPGAVACWHWHPLGRFFDGNSGGDQAVLVSCTGGQHCCISAAFPDNGGLWSLGCAHCSSDNSRLGLEAGANLSGTTFVAHPAAFALQSPWDGRTLEACVWEPRHECWLQGRDGSATEECPGSSCCFASQDRRGCAPCLLGTEEDRSCGTWAEVQGRAVNASARLLDFFRPVPAVALGEAQRVCLCRGSRCNEELLPEEAAPVAAARSPSDPSDPAEQMDGELLHRLGDSLYRAKNMMEQLAAQAAADARILAGSADKILRLEDGQLKEVHRRPRVPTEKDSRFASALADDNGTADSAAVLPRIAAAVVLAAALLF